MKLSFALIIFTIVAVSVKSEKYSLKKMAKECHDKCGSSEEDIKRINKHMMEHTLVDRCYTECGWKAVGQMKDDGNLDMEKIYAQFTDHGLEIPPGTEKLANTNGDMDILMDVGSEWVKKNKDIVYEAYLYEFLE